MRTCQTSHTDELRKSAKCHGMSIDYVREPLAMEAAQPALSAGGKLLDRTTWVPGKGYMAAAEAVMSALGLHTSSDWEVSYQGQRTAGKLTRVAFTMQGHLHSKLVLLDTNYAVM